MPPGRSEVVRQLDTGSGDLRARVEHGVGIVMLNRPDRLNALSPGMLDALARVLPVLETSPDVGALLLTGAGRAFCAGGDVKSFAERGGASSGGVAPQEQIARQQASERATTGRLYGFTKPTVAALPGAVAGAGIGLALACDLRVGDDRTLFAAGFGKVGLPGDYGAIWLLNRLAGPARTRQLLFLDRRLDAATASEWGLIDQLAGPGEDVFDVALGIAVALASGPRQAYAAMKHNLLDAERSGLLEAMDLEVPRHVFCGLTDDHREAARAFAEKRPPRWASTAG